MQTEVSIVGSTGGIYSRLGTASVSSDEILYQLETNSELIRAQLPGIRFSKTMLWWTIRMYGKFPSEIHVELGVTKNGRFIPIETETDHVVIGTTWHPIRKVERREIDKCLTSLDVTVGKISADKAFGISSHLDGTPYLIDQIDRSDAITWSSESMVDPPAALVAELFPYQLIGFRALTSLAENGVGALLADEMGLGKTLQVIALLTSVSPTRALVVVPASLLENWRRELSIFAPTLSVHIHAGSKRSGLVEGISGFDVVLTTYEVVVSDIGMLSDIDWSLVVLDEAQYIRNPLSQRSIAAKRLPRRIGLAVTGTPVENSLRDLWSLAEFVLPTLLGGLSDFEENFPDEYSAGVRLGEIVAPVTIRRRVTQVAKDLPAKIEILTAFELDAGDKVNYQYVESTRSAFEANTTLRVLCAHASEGGGFGSAEFAMRPKTQHLIDLLREIFDRSEKALIFSSYSMALRRLQATLEDEFRGGEFVIVDGTTEISDRQMIIDQFSKSQRPAALILNPKAAGVGLNITAANHVIHFNPEYNPAVTAQATARSFRRKQERPVFVHHFFYTSTVEEQAVMISAGKRDLASGVDDGVNTE